MMDLNGYKTDIEQIKHDVTEIKQSTIKKD